MLRKGIRLRLFINFLILSIVILSLLGSYVLWYDYRQNLNNVQSHLIKQSAAIEQLIPYLFNKKDSDIDAEIKAIGTKLNIRITVIAPSGKVIADSVEHPEVMENHGTRIEVIAALRGEPASEIRYSETLHTNLVYAAFPIRLNSQIAGVVRLATPLVEAESGFNQVRSALLAALFLTILFALILSARLAKRFTEPLENITTAAKEIADGSLEKRVHIRTGDEIELLGHALNHLASNLEDHVNEIVAEKLKLELILHHMENAVILLDRFGRVTMANRAAASSFSITDTMLGNHNIQVIGNSMLDRAVQEAITSGQSRLITLKVGLRSGKNIFQVYLEPVQGSEKDINGVLCVFHDITALQEIYERQSDFIANASHELATPLTAIKGFAETLLDGALEDRQISSKFVNIIYSEAERMQRLVQDLLQLAKLDSQEYRRQIKVEPSHLKPLIDMVVNELSPGLTRKKLIITVKHPDQNVAVLANPDWLKQVFVNLLDNSIKYTPEGGTVSVSYWLSDNKVHVSVKDTGIGIPAKDLPLIFERFYRVDRARTRSAGGTGLGLAIVRYIIEIFGGKIEVDSEPDKGTTFTFWLPLTEINE